MFKPMLATNTKIRDLRLPVMTSLKLEGVRGEFTPDGLRTRPMKKFNNRWLEVHFKELALYCKFHKIHLQGEIYIHGRVFSDISSICRRAEHPETGDLEIFIFDMWDPAKPHQPFIDRYIRLCDAINAIDRNHIKVAHQHIMEDYPSIEKMYENAIIDEYEGLCFKDPNAAYKHGRSTKNEQKFLRLKPENTYDGIVLEIVERFENLVESQYNELGYLSKTQDKDMKAHTGMAAVAVTKCPDFDEPIRVTLSRGLTDADRADIWDSRDDYIGKHIRFVGIPVAGMLPRAPRFDAWRTDLD